MIILIDGYNLLKAIFPRKKEKLDKKRDQLIRQLGFYKQQKADTIKQIILVFDGGYVSRATREICNGVVVIFSGQRRSADDWIAEYVEKNKEKELMLVSRDRGLIARCKKYGVEVLKVFDFYEIMQDRLLEGVGEELEQRQGDGGVHKYERDESEICEIKSAALDLLMEHTLIEDYEKEDDLFDEGERREKGESRTPSKKEKKRLSKLKKL